MKPIDQLESDAYFRLLLQGEPGAGKTTLCCSLPSPIFIDIDGNLAGPVRYQKAHNLPVPVGYYRIDRDNEGKEIALGSAQWARLDQCLGECIKNPDCQTIILDSATGLADIMFRETQRANPSVKDGRQVFSFFLQDCKRLMARLTQMQKNVVLTAHERIEFDPMTVTAGADGIPKSGLKQYRVNWPGQFGDYIGAFFTNVWRCEVQDVPFGKPGPGKRVVRTAPGTQFPGLKNDYELPAVWEFNWQELENKMKQKP